MEEERCNDPAPSCVGTGTLSAQVTRLFLVVALAVLAGCATIVDNAIADAISSPAETVRARHGAAPMPGDPQTLMTRPTRVQPGDRARADRLLAETRAAIARYRSVEAAEADGYQMFPPEQPVPVVHYVHRERSEREVERIDPRRPGALLYERTPGGGLRLLGAMFTAPADAPLGELDRRVPLSVTQWHLHQNVCVPRPLWNEDAWTRRAPDGRPLFGPGSPTVTRAACNRAGGRFLPTVFGWMAHVNVFAHDPADVWNAHYGHGEHEGHATHENHDSHRGSPHSHHHGQ